MSTSNEARADDISRRVDESLSVDLNSLDDVTRLMHDALRLPTSRAFRELYAHRKRLLSRVASTPRGSTPLLEEIRRLSAACRALSAQAKRRNPAGARRDLAKINAVLGIRTTTRPAARTPFPDWDDEPCEYMRPNKSEIEGAI